MTDTAHSPLAAGSVVGILGGGQLGRMLALAAAAAGFDVHVYDPEPDCPAGRVSARCVTAAWDDEAALRDFASLCDAVTFEFENVPAATLALLETLAPLAPSRRSLELTQDRLVEKRFVRGLGLSPAPFAPVDGAFDLEAALAATGLPAILKTRTLGYDGKGQARVGTLAEAREALAALGGANVITEGLVAFACEISIVLARSRDGSIAAYEPSRNVHDNGVLSTSSVPAAISAAASAAAVEAATRIAHALDHVGVLAVEFFVLPGDSIVVNEIAPRVHNSGHWTTEACVASQFANHIRAVCGWPLGSSRRLTGAVVMDNVLGETALGGADLLRGPNDALHLYGKRAAKPGRKMGHRVTVLDT